MQGSRSAWNKVLYEHVKKPNMVSLVKLLERSVRPKKLYKHHSALL